MTLNLTLRQFLDESRHVARIGDHEAHAADLHEHEAVRGQREDVVQRDRGDDHFLADAQVRAEPRGRLQHVGDHVAMGQHRALRDAGRAAGVLQESDVVVIDLDVRQLAEPAERKRIFEAHLVLDAIRRHELLDVTDDEIGDQRLRETEHVAERGRDDVLDRRRMRQHFGDRRREVVEHDERAGAGVVELMLELARCVERIGVHDRQPGAQDAERRDRILQHVGQHDRDAIALGELEVVEEIGGELRAEAVDFVVGQRLAHVRVRGAVAELVEGRSEHVGDRAIRVDVYFRRHPGRVVRQPGPIVVRGHCSPPFLFCWFPSRQATCQDVFAVDLSMLAPARQASARSPPPSRGERGENSLFLHARKYRKEIVKNGDSATKRLSVVRR